MYAIQAKVVDEATQKALIKQQRDYEKHFNNYEKKLKELKIKHEEAEAAACRFRSAY